MASINPYIHFNGNAEEAFHFYKSVFGGEFATLVRFKDMHFEGAPSAAKEAEKIMHISLPIGGHSVLMGSDTPEQLGRHRKQKPEAKSPSAPKAKKKPTASFMDCLPAGKLKCRLKKVHGAHILECSETNLASNGW
ncbi:MAG TPA: hypothetical protein PKK64_11305 [Saprospiraceae bacterium]|nr:hypothetical protein [Saprospiraceae bacterium]HMX88871.1 hypothetical protein [Saprospiraceae bacterium]HMZ41000.1 hypothetical protein [Saprospiraceae bacterium]HNA64373.1 hypothetical protein [Saprospiraceae bacterium]HNB31027.1 hypothetical protein [Saprospiraceae bacterium]